MKKTYDKNQRSKPKTRNQTRNQTRSQVSAPKWATTFIKENSEYASSAILDNLSKFDQAKQSALEKAALHVLTDGQLKNNERLRNGAVRLVVALLPKTFAAFENLLGDSSSNLWYEVHFTLFSSLDRDDLREADQDRVIALIEKYLMNAESQAGFAAWKAGDILGDEWQSPETVRVLERVVVSAKHVAARRAALHGIVHAIEKVSTGDGERLHLLLRKVTSEDPSKEIRSYGAHLLENGGCVAG